MIKVSITDDEVLFRSGMQLLVNNFDGMEVLFQAGNGQELLDKLGEIEVYPDVALLDLKMPVLNGIETAKILTEKYPDIKIVVLSTYFSKPFVFNMLEIGAAGYLVKNSSPEDVELTINNVHENGFYYSPAVMEIIKDNLTNKKRIPKPSFNLKLTRREKEILQLICEQYTNHEIGEKLFISSRTVDGHRNNLLQKMNCRNTAGLVSVAILQELIEIDPSRFWKDSL